MRDRFSMAEGHFLFGFSVVLLFIYSLSAFNHDFLTYALLAELVIFLGPVVFMAIYMNISFKKAISWNPMAVKQWCYSLLFFTAVIPSVLFVNIISSIFFDAIGLQSDSGLPLPQNTGELILQLLIIAGVTSVCEEVFFRGMLYNALFGASNNTRFSMVFSAFLFAIMHFDIQNFINPFLLGILFAWINKQTGSIKSSIIGHTLINSMAILLMFLFNIEGLVLEQSLQTKPQFALLTGIMIGSVLAAVFFYKQLVGLKASTDEPSLDPVLKYDLNEWLRYEKSFIIPLGVVLFYSLLTLALWF